MVLGLIFIEITRGPFPPSLLQFSFFSSQFSPLFPCLFFPNTSAKISRSEVSAGHSAPLPPPPPRLLRHWFAAPKICRKRARKGREGRKKRREDKEIRKRAQRKRRKRETRAGGKMYYVCETPPWNCQKIIKDTEIEAEMHRGAEKSREKMDKETEKAGKNWNVRKGSVFNEKY